MKSVERRDTAEIADSLRIVGHLAPMSIVERLSALAEFPDQAALEIGFDFIRNSSDLRPFPHKPFRRNRWPILKSMQNPVANRTRLPRVPPPHDQLATDHRRAAGNLDCLCRLQFHDGKNFCDQYSGVITVEHPGSGGSYANHFG